MDYSNTLKFRWLIFTVIGVNFFIPAANSAPDSTEARVQAIQDNWAGWKQRISAQISDRFKKLIEMRRSHTTSEEKTCSLVFVLSRAQEIKFLRSSQTSSDPDLDMAAFIAVKTLKDTRYLQLPTDSNVGYVECTVVFSKKGLESFASKLTDIPPPTGSIMPVYNIPSRPLKFPPDVIGY